MKTTIYILKGFINAGGVFAYVSLIALFVFNGEKIFGGQPSLLIPLFMLLLFIVSALITGSLVLGKPILLYFDGLRKEAFVLLFTTLAWHVLFLAVIMGVLLLG